MTSPKKYKPVYLPFNESASRLTASLAADIGVAINEKHSAILASFLYYVQISGVGNILTWPTGNVSKESNGFSFYPASGGTVIANIRKALISSGYLTDVKELPFGLLDLNRGQLAELMGVTDVALIKPGTFYKLNDKPVLHDPLFVSALFVEALKPYVLVNKPEEISKKILRKREHNKTPKLSYGEVYRGKSKRRVTDAVRTVKEMNAFWLQHPLTMPPCVEVDKKRATLYASATRIFHNGSLISGGRWYGSWLHTKSAKRLDLLIDGEPICEVDLNASQPSLLSSLLGVKMNVGDTWTDVYLSVVDLLNADMMEEKLLRSMVKTVLVEMIGTGNHQRTGPAKPYKPSKENPPSYEKAPSFIDCDYSKQMYQQIQVAALEVFPAIKQLETNYFNATGFLSYHGSEILTLTLLKLKTKGVVAYGVHDSIIVKRTDKDIAVETYRDIIRNYCLKHQRSNNYPSLGINVAITIEEKQTAKVKLEGCYD